MFGCCAHLIGQRVRDLATSQITVRARECQGRPKSRPFFIGDVLGYRGQDWIVVGLFMGLDQASTEVEEYLVLEGRQIVEPLDEGREARGKAV
jgi:hypothetical protein